METRVLPFGDAAIAQATVAIRSGAPVAVPTETVYGLAGNATDDAAVAAIYAAKGRPAFNPLIVHVRDADAAFALGHFSATARRLAATHWPGPLTLVVPIAPGAVIGRLATAGLSTVAIRVPRHRAMQALLRATDLPLAAPSANASGRLSPTTADHVMQSLGGRIPMIIDDGASGQGIESTIVAVNGDTIRLLRPGPVIIAGAVLVTPDKIEAPGQLAAHYAPTKPLRLDALVAHDGETLIGFGTVIGDYNLSPTGDLVDAAARLFDLLHRAEQSACPCIAVAPIPHAGLGIAINDRLARAAVGAGS